MCLRSYNSFEAHTGLMLPSLVCKSDSFKPLSLSCCGNRIVMLCLKWGFRRNIRPKINILTTAPFKPDNAQSGVGNVKFCSTVTSMENKLQSANTDDV